MELKVSPILKWVGGKRQLLGELTKEVPKNYSTYYEPFLGGGALLFHLQPKRAVVNDLNQELINVYLMVQTELEALLTDLKKHRNEEKYYYKLRALDRKPEVYEKLTSVERASRIIYLNKTCYNGLYRVNKSGQFNTPFGYYERANIVNEERLRALHQYLNEAEISFHSTDFAAIFSQIPKDSFVYLDPPYDPVSETSNFTSYQGSDFGREEQIRLKEVCDLLTKKKIKFLLSNSATDFILDLYQDYAVKYIEARRAVNSNPRGRGPVREVLIKNY